MFEVVRNLPRASAARSSEISWTRALVSLDVVVAERSWESFARRQGWVETWTLEGREAMIVLLFGLDAAWGIDGDGEKERRGGEREALLGVSQGLFVGCRSASVDRAHRYVHCMRMLQYSTLLCPMHSQLRQLNADPAARSFPYRSALQTRWIGAASWWDMQIPR